MMRIGPPGWFRKLEACILTRSFARAFGVAPPSLRGLSAEEALGMYRSFTAACMELALSDDRVALLLRSRLGEEALAMGRVVRRLVPGADAHAMAMARFCYRGIGIGLEGMLPGELRFAPCMFSGRYTPKSCWFMSAFDEGFLRGLSGLTKASLVFSCRLTEGAPCCAARFGLDD